jgi:hypothetical protein
VTRATGARAAAGTQVSMVGVAGRARRDDLGSKGAGRGRVFSGPAAVPRTTTRARQSAWCVCPHAPATLAVTGLNPRYSVFKFDDAARRRTPARALD